MTVILELPPEKEAALQAQAQARGLTVQQWILQLAEHSGPSPVSEDDRNDDDRPIWEVIAEEAQGVPPEDMAALPGDGASQIDHYVYGLPKRER